MQTTSSFPIERTETRRSARLARPPDSQLSSQTNVGQGERVVSALLGGALLLTAIRRPSPAAAALVVGGGALLQRGVTGHCYVHQALGRNTAQTTSAQRGKRGTERSITIEKPADELYREWRDPRHVSALMGDFAEIQGLPDGRWLWRAKLPLGKTCEWTTRVVEDIPSQRIAWATEPDAPFTHRGSVRFRSAPRDWGTEVTLHLEFGTPGGALAKLAHELPRIPKAFELAVLRRCKALSVAGEIPSLRRNPSARARSVASRSLLRS